MTQEELDEILMDHQLWLSTQGKEGSRANFDSEWIGQKYEVSPQSMWIEFSEGGVAAFGGQPFQAGEPCSDCVVSHFTKLNFNRADLYSANFGDAIFYECDMTGVNFSACDLSKAKFAKVDFKGANFGFGAPKAIFSGGTFASCDFEECFLQHVNFDNCNLSSANFSGCSMPISSFRNSVLYRARFNATWLLSADFERANLKEASFNNSDISGANFSFANLNLSSFVSANISGVEFRIKSFFHRVAESFSSDRKNQFIGCRTDDAYGNERFKRLVSDGIYIEEVCRDKPNFYKFWLISSDCGRSLNAWLIWTFIVILCFSFIYYFLGCSHFQIHQNINNKESFVIFLYFSVVAFTTLGFGDISPTSSWAMFWVMLEVFVGFVMLGVLISIGANKVSQRS